jgi:hypothetical protein
MDERFKNTVIFGVPASDEEIGAIGPIAFICAVIFVVCILIFAPDPKTVEKKPVQKTDTVKVK